MGSAPFHKSAFDAGGFLKFVAEQGGEVLAPTNQWELARYRVDGVHIVYTKANGKLTYTGGSEGHYRAFMRGDALGEKPQAKPKAKAKPKRQRIDKAKLRADLLDRDGPVCWFCGCFMAPDDQTIEHLVAKSNGGPNGLDNYALAHGVCNRAAGNVPLVEKIALREGMRDARAELPPWEWAA